MKHIETFGICLGSAPTNIQKARELELLHRKEELLFLKEQLDSEKSMDNLRHDCIIAELTEIERQIKLLKLASNSSPNTQQALDEEELLRQERIGQN